MFHRNVYALAIWIREIVSIPGLPFSVRQLLVNGIFENGTWELNLLKNS
jgi:hypothetical protein